MAKTAIETGDHNKKTIPIIIQISGQQIWGFQCLINKLLPVILNMWLQPCKVPIYLLLVTLSQTQTQSTMLFQTHHSKTLHLYIYYLNRPSNLWCFHSFSTCILMNFTI